MVVRASNPDLAAAARGLGKGAGLRIKGLVLEGQSAASTLDLRRFHVWRPDAVVEVDGQAVTPPTTAYFRGTVSGEENSVAVVSIRESGEVQGIVQKGGRSWLVGKGRNQRALHSKNADGELPPFECGNDDAFSLEEQLGVADPAPALLATEAAATVLDQPYVANIAIETDYEFYAKFGNTAAALDYIGDLIGYADVAYSREVSTDMQIGFSRLWTGGPDSDPWKMTQCIDANRDGVFDVSPCGINGTLGELKSYWNANMSSVNRTLTHMLSGRGLGGGIAYIGVLCQNYYSRGASSDYGVSTSLGGNLVWDGDQTHDPLNVVWDIVVVQHEIGHNFNSPHTQQYCNIGTSSLPIDNCYAGCQSGATIGLPSCSQPTPYFTSGGGAGTIMSYCHQLSGGYGNLAMTFGKGHPCGTKPERAAARMSDHVAARASSYPTCFAAPKCGNGVLDQGEQCDGLSLGAATCVSSGFLGGTLGCSPTCTLNTAKCTNCGNNVIDAGEVCDGTALGGGSCGAEGCTSGTVTCNATCTDWSKTGCFGCQTCNDNGICDSGENCTGCPSDCDGGMSGGARCGNGICEAGNGEDCLSCAADCNGNQGGKPSSRYCCGDGSGEKPVPCSDARCTASRTCTTVTVNPTEFCCGNGSCEIAENCSICGVDCGGAPEVCGNGIDDNCNGKIDCTDTSCSSLSSCQCRARDTSCTTNSQCCSGNCRSTGKSAYTCS